MSQEFVTTAIAVSFSLAHSSCLSSRREKALQHRAEGRRIPAHSARFSSHHNDDLRRTSEMLLSIAQNGSQINKKNYIYFQPGLPDCRNQLRTNEERTDNFDDDLLWCILSHLSVRLHILADPMHRPLS